MATAVSNRGGVCALVSRLRCLVVFLLLFGCSSTPGEPSVDSCADGTLLDADGACVPEACGTGTWGALEPHPTEPTFWVDVAVGTDGDGTREAPFARLSTALEAAVEVSGGRVLIAGGRYLERLSFNRAHDGLELVGRCPDLVVIDGEGLAAPTMSIFASSVVVRDLTITGGRPGIIAGEVPGASGLVLRGNGLVVDGNGGYGVLATGSGVLVDLAETVVRDIWPTNELSPGRGVGVDQTASLVGIGLTIEQIQGIGVQVLAGEAEIEESTIRDGLTQNDGTWGRGVHVVGGGLTLSRSTVGLHPERGVEVEAGGRLNLLDSELAGASAGHTARVSGGGRIHAERSQLGAPSGLGVQAIGNNSLLELLDTLVEAGPDASLGPLVSVEAAAALLASQATFVGGFGRAVHVAGADTVGSFTETEVSETRGGQPDFDPGIALLVTDGADVEASQLMVTNAAGPGLLAARGATARCVGCIVEGATFAATLVTGSAQLELEGGQLRGTRAHGELQGGVGALGAGGGAGNTRLQVDDTYIVDMPHAGVALRGAGSWRVASALIETAGVASSAPGVLASEGTSFWQTPDGPGLFVFDVTFRQLPNDAILLDGATGTISGSTFDGVGQLELYTQNCGSVLPPDVAEALQTNDCTGPPRVLGPPLEWPASPLAPGLPD